MSLMGGLWVGNAGMTTSQNALNTVAHNLSNLQTEGYVRQQVAQSDKTYMNVSSSSPMAKPQIGIGSYYSETRHVRSTFLDASYRKEYGRFNFYEVSYDTFLEIENILGELEGAAFNDSTNDLWTAFEEVAKSPADASKIGNLVQAGYNFVQNANAVSDSFRVAQSNLNEQIKDMVASINEIGEQIVDLNRQIQKIEAAGVENANDLRDKRDLLIDELSGYANIECKELTNTCVTVKINGVDFVNSEYYNKIDMMVDDYTKYVTPYWTQNVSYKEDPVTHEVTKDYSSAYVYDLTQEISTAADTDVGALRALLLARGDHHGDYTDLDVSIMTDRKLEALGITADEYNEEYGKQYYDEFISESIMMGTEAEFDQLVHKITTMINSIIMDAAQPEKGYLCNADGTPMQFIQKQQGDAFKKVTKADIAADKDAIDWDNDQYVKIYDEDGEFTGDYWVFVKEDVNDPRTWYSPSNIQINQELMQTPSMMIFVKPDDTVDYELAKKFIDEFAKADMFLNPNATKISNIQDYYTDFVSKIANSGSMYKNLYENEQITIEQVEYERAAITGVSSDEELEHMIMYQNAYNAASRYINVLTTMLDSLLSMAA